MSRRSITKDERFLLAIYTAVNKSIEEPILEAAIRQKEGLSESTTRNILNILSQTGFIRYKKREGVITLTERGVILCQEIEDQIRFS